MSKRKQTYLSRVRPFLMSDEVMNLTGITRHGLNEIERHGICKPVHVKDLGGVSAWMPSQIGIIADAKDLHDEGMPYEQVSRILGEGTGVFEDKVSKLRAQRAREAKRKERCALREREWRKNAEEIICFEDMYLRFEPDSYVAMVRHRTDMGATLKSNSHYSAVLGTIEVSRIVGWSHTSVIGSMIEVVGDLRAACSYVALAGQRDSSSSWGAKYDGCYHAFGGPCAKLDARQECELCELYGCAMSKGKEVRLRELESSSSCDKRFFRPTKSGNGLLGPAEPNECWPSICEGFPQGVTLPLGVVPVFVPGGYYLCRRCDESNRERRLNEMIGLVSALPHIDGDRDGATSTHAFKYKPVESGKIPDGISALYSSFAEGTGFALFCEMLPSNTQDGLPCYEIRVPVKLDSGAKMPA